MLSTPASDNPKCLTLAFFDQLLHRTSNVVHGDVRGDAVLVEQVDAVGPQPLESLFCDLPDAFGTAVEAFRWYAVHEAELGCNDDLVTERLRRFAYDFFIQLGTVCFSGIEECHTPVVGRSNDLNSLIFSVAGQTRSLLPCNRIRVLRLPNRSSLSDASALPFTPAKGCKV